MESPYLFKNADSYDTPAATPKSRLFRLPGCRRWYFYAGNFGIFCRAGRSGKAGKLDKNAQIFYSSGNIRLIERCGGKVHLRGLANLRAVADRPVVLIGNHMSLLETAVFHAVIREYVDFSFVVKESLLKVPYFREILLALGAIPVTRSNPREDLKTVLTQGKKLLQSGRSLIVFPQSTRSGEIDPEKFNSLGVKIAKSAGVPVVPFALKTDFLANGRWIRDLGAVRPEREVWFEFAPAMEISGNGQTEQQAIVDFITSRVAAWRSAESKKDPGERE